MPDRIPVSPSQVSSSSERARLGGRRAAARAGAARGAGGLAPPAGAAGAARLGGHLSQLITHANYLGNVHGGEIMRLIDTAAGIAVGRHADGPTVTASLDELSFLHPVRVATSCS